MIQKLRLLPLLAFLAVAVVIGCGGDSGSLTGASGGGNGGGNGGGSGGGKGPDAPTVAKLDSFFATHSSTDINVTANALVAYAKSLDTIASAANVDGIVRLVFKSGTKRAFIANRSAASTTAPAIALPRQNLPNGKQALVMNGFGTYNDAGAAKNIAGMLSRAGYSVTATSPSMATLSTLSAKDVIFISTHGFYDPDTKHFWMWTSDNVADPSLTDDTDPVVQKYGKDMVTCVLSASGDNTDPGFHKMDHHYCVSEKFLAGHLNTKTGGLIVIDSCEAALPGSPLPGIVSAPGGAVVLYNNAIDSDLGGKADCYIFDRILVDNVKSGASIPKETPPQRPFDLSAVVQDARGRKPAIVPFQTSKSTSKVTTDWVVTGNALLSPSIEFVTLDGYRKTASITGNFGSKQGTVTIGGANMTIKKWGSTQIDLQDVPETAHGDVVVAVDGRESNKVKLTYWQLILNYKESGPDNFEVKDTMVLNIRADVHDFREKPHAATQKSLVTFSCDKDSKATWSASGTSNGVVLTGSGSTTMISPSDFTGGALFFGFGDFNTQTGNFDLNLEQIVQDAYTYIPPAPGIPVSLPLNLNPKLFIPPVDNQHFPSLRIPFTKQFEIAAGTRSFQESAVTFTLDWELAPPIDPPATEDAR